MRCGLIGERLTHSYSCEIHAMLADYEYRLIELAPEDLEAFLKSRSFDAINVTIPYKQAVMPYLDKISPGAESIGAVNTVVNRNGRLFGYNTDLPGMLALAQRTGVDAKGKKVLILGTGGTSKTAFHAAKTLGAGEIYKVSRSGRDGALTYAEAAEKHCDAQIVFNTTPAGMFPRFDTQAISLEGFDALEALLDVVYNPLRTNLVLAAQAMGAAADGGLYMLAAQAVYASALFLGRKAARTDIERAYGAVYNSKRNIALIGMPSCGKSSVGRLLAEKTGKAFFDSDEIIAERTGMPIAEFFARQGEAAFRTIEHEVLAELAAKSGAVIATGGGAVIATGGGAVLDGDNMRALKRGGTAVFLDRSPEKLVSTPDRPLSSDRESLMRRYAERYEKYLGAADVTVNGDGTVDETAEKVYETIMAR